MAMQSTTANNNITKIQFIVEIKNTSELTTFESEKVFVRGQPWFIKFAKVDDFLSVHLHSLNGDASDTWSMVATFSVKMIRSENFGKQYCNVIGPVVFDSENTESGDDEFFDWDSLMDPENGYLTNDECKFRIKIKTGPLQDDSSNEWMKFETRRKCCGDSSYGNFKLTINKLHEFSSICSPKFKLYNVQWRIVAIKGKYLRILLLNIYNNIWYFDMESKCTLLSLDDNVENIEQKIEGSDATESPHEIFQFPWEDLNDMEKSFMELNGSFNLDLELKLDHPEEPPNIVKEQASFPCSICFDNMIGRDVSVTECGHLFCTQCIILALRQAVFCPNCKSRSNGIVYLRKVYLPSNW